MAVTGSYPKKIYPRVFRSYPKIDQLKFYFNSLKYKKYVSSSVIQQFTKMFTYIKNNHLNKKEDWFSDC